jgi:hypothetical protein
VWPRNLFIPNGVGNLHTIIDVPPSTMCQLNHCHERSENDTTPIWLHSVTSATSFSNGIPTRIHPLMSNDWLHPSVSTHKFVVEMRNIINFISSHNSTVKTSNHWPWIVFKAFLILVLTSLRPWGGQGPSRPLYNIFVHPSAPTHWP